MREISNSLVLKVLLLGLALFPASARARFTFRANLADVQPNASGERVLQNDTIYFVTNDLTRTSSANGAAAFTVAPDAMVAICVGSNSTLSATGANAVGTRPGSAGIRVTQGATLFIYGDGTVTATGGAAASGTAGKGGNDGHTIKDDKWGSWYGDDKWVDSDYKLVGGIGGAGGDGGGGGAAGIGGNGGAGGRGAQPNHDSQGHQSGSHKNPTADYYSKGTRALSNGYDGARGGTAGDPDSAGALYILGSSNLTVTARGGKAVTTHALGGGAGARRHYPHDTSCCIRHFSCGGGGGGGGGGAGGGALGFSGGGSGGGGGGSGGGGGTVYRWASDTRVYWKWKPDFTGGGGLGGAGGTSVTGAAQHGGGGGKGGQRADNNHSVVEGWHIKVAAQHDFDQSADVLTGNSGDAGTTTQAGLASRVQISSDVKFDGGGARALDEKVETHARLSFGYWLKHDAETDWVSCLYRGKAANVPHLTDDLRVFFGYYTKPDGEGILCFDSEGICATPFYFYDDTTVHAHIVKKSDVKWTGVTVNGRDCAYRTGNGWRWSPTTKTLLLAAGGASPDYLFEISGINTNGDVHVKVMGDAAVRFRDLTLESSVNPAQSDAPPLFEVAETANVRLEVAGSNTLTRLLGVTSAIAVSGALTITNATDAVETILVASGGYQRPAVDILGSGTLTVGGGHLFLNAGRESATALGTGVGDFRLRGGTLVLSGGMASDFKVASTVITGGALAGSRFDTSSEPGGGRPKDAKNKPLWCVRTAVPDQLDDTKSVSVSGLEGYGVNELYTTGGFLHLWLTNGPAIYQVNEMTARARVESANTYAFFATTGVMVDYIEVGRALGDGWRWSPATSNLFFTAPGTRIISGTNTLGEVHPIVDRDLALTFDELELAGDGIRGGVFEITGETEVQVTLRGQSCIYGRDHFRGTGLFVDEQAMVTIAAKTGLSDSLVATGGVWGAGIGSGQGNAGRIILKSGTVAAFGGFEGAGIGGGAGAGGGQVEIESAAQVTAVGGTAAAGVGGGAWCARAGTLVNHGGQLQAQGGRFAEDCGGGCLDIPFELPPTPDEPGTSLVVESVADSGPGSLRSAVMAAVNQRGGTVTFSPAVTSVVLSRPLVFDTTNCSAPVVIDGDSGVTLVPAADYHAGHGYGALFNAGTGDLQLRALAFVGFGDTDDRELVAVGASIRSAGELRLENCTFSQTRAVAYGGAVYAGPGAAVFATNCRFADCHAEQASGGAIYGRARILLSRSAFIGNSSRYGGGGAGLHADEGYVLAENCAFFTNIAGERGGGVDVGAGDAALGAVTLTANAGGAAYAARLLALASVASVGNLSWLAEEAPDGASGEELRAAHSIFGTVAPGKFTTVRVGYLPADVFIAVDADGRAGLRTREVDGVEQTYAPLTHANKDYLRGAAVYRSADWTSLGFAASTRSGETMRIYGDARPRVACTGDQLGVMRDDTRLLVGSVVAAAEKESLVITRLDDVTDLEDNLISLREALAYSTSPDLPHRADGYAVLSVDEALFDPTGHVATLVVTNYGPIAGLNLSNRIFASLTGPGAGASLRLCPGSDVVSTLFTVAPSNALELVDLTFLPPQNDAALSTYRYLSDSAGDLTLRNCRLDGEGRGMNAIRSTGGKLWIEYSTICSNVSYAAGVPLIESRREGHLLSTTVVNNFETAGDLPLVSVPTGQFDVVSATFVRGPSVAIRAGTGSDAKLLNSIVVGGVTGIGSSSQAYNAVTNDESSVLEPKTIVATVRGVPQLARRPTKTGSAYRQGRFAYHSDNWLAVAYGPNKTGGSTKKAFRGARNSATMVETRDQVGREIVQNYVSCGAYATPKDEEHFDDGVIEVNVPDDYNTATRTVDQDYDGKITLRDACVFACTHPEFRDAHGDCTVKFADVFFGGGDANTIYWKLWQIEIASGFTRGSLRIAPPIGRRVVLDGSGGYRHFAIGEGNRVVFNSLTFQNGIATSLGGTALPLAGGAIHNAGTLFASNCVFKSSAAGGSWTRMTGNAHGGAIATASTGRTRVTASTFSGNAAICGGALYTAENGDTVAVDCTFTGNRAVSSFVSPEDPRGGAVCAEGTASRTVLVNCTIAGNESQGYGGGIYARSSNVRPALDLLNCVVVGNTASNGANDLFSYGETRLAYTAFGERVSAMDDVWVDDTVTTNVTTSAAFASLDPTGRPVPVPHAGEHVTHEVLPLKGALGPAAVVSLTDDGDHILYGAMDLNRLLSGVYRVARARGTRLLTDQIGVSFPEPRLGALAEYASTTSFTSVKPKSLADPSATATTDAEQSVVGSVDSSTDARFDETAALRSATARPAGPLLAVPNAPESEMFVVTAAGDTNETDKVTLREALEYVVSHPAAVNAEGTRRISFDLAGGSVTLTGRVDLATVSTGFVLDGANPDGDDTPRGVVITADAEQPASLIGLGGGDVVFSNLTFAACSSTNAPGGAVSVSGGNFSAVNCRFDSCQAPEGGAVALLGGRGFFRNCTFAGNGASAGDGGAILATNSATAVVLTSSFVGNSAAGEGGAVADNATNATVVVANATLWNNSAGRAGGALSFATNSVARVTNLLLLENTAPTAADLCLQTTNACLFCVALDSTVTPAVPATALAVAPATPRENFVYGPVNTNSCNGVVQIWQMPRFQYPLSQVAVVHETGDWRNIAVLVSNLESEDQTAYDLLGHVEFAEEGGGEVLPEMLSDDQLDASVIRPCLGSVFSTGAVKLTFDPAPGTVTDPTVYAVYGLPSPRSPLAARENCALSVWRDSSGATRFYADGTAVGEIWTGTDDETFSAVWVEADKIFKVTTSDDNDGDLTDDQVSLREALRSVTGNPELRAPDGTRTIRFDCAESLIRLKSPLVALGGTVTIDGLNEGRGLTLSPDGEVNTPLLAVFQSAVSLENLTIAAAESVTNGAVVVSNGVLTARNCLFRDNAATTAGGGAVSVLAGEAGAAAAFTNCAFVANRAATTGGAVFVSGAGAAVEFVNVTFSENQSAETGVGAVAAANGGTVTTRNTTFVRNSPEKAAYGSPAVNELVPVVLSDDLAFAGAAITTLVETVAQVWYEPLASAHVTEGAVETVGFDQSGAPVSRAARGAFRSRLRSRVIVDPNGGNYTGPFVSGECLCGSPMPAIGPDPTRSGRAFRGWSYSWVDDHTVVPFASPAVVKATWNTSPGSLLVTNPVDDESPKDGRVTLRSALAALSDDPLLVGEDGTRTIRFDFDATEINLSSSVVVRAGVEAIAIDGQNAGRGLTIRPAAGVATRLLDVNGSSVSLANIQFIGGATDASGAAVRVSGSGARLSVSNCAFSANAATNAAGAALAFTSGAQGEIRDASFFANTVGSSVVDATDGSRCTFANCSFVTNEIAALSADATSSFASEQCTFACGAATAGVSAWTSVNDLVAADSATLPNLLEPVVWRSVVGTVLHAWMRPRTAESVLNCDQPSALLKDELGAPAAFPGRGAVRSTWIRHLALDPAPGTWTKACTSNDIVTVLGEPLPAEVSVPRYPGHSFLGWYSAAGEQVYNGEGVLADGVARFADQTLRARWRSEASIEVATGEDGEDLDSGLLTLREALRYLVDHPQASAPDLPRKISFAVSVERVSLLAPLALDFGANPLDGVEFVGNGVTLDLGSLSLTGAGLCRMRDLTVVSSEPAGASVLDLSMPLVAENCAFREIRPSGASSSPIRIQGGRSVFASCSFTGGRGTDSSAVHVCASAAAAFVYSTFGGNGDETAAAAVTAEAGGEVVVLNSTFTGNGSNGQGAAVNGNGATLKIVGSLFAGNTGSSDVFAAGGSLSLVRSTGRPFAGTGSVEKSEVVELADPSALLRTTTPVKSVICGVKQTCYLPRSKTADGIAGGVAVWHADDWEALAYSEGLNGSGKVALFGSVTAATTRCPTDQMGDVIETLLRGSVVVDGSVDLTVDTADDFEEISGERTSLRTAFNAVARGYAISETDGSYRIDFAPSLFVDGVATVSVNLDLPMVLEDSCRLVIAGPGDGRRVRLLVQGGAAISNGVFQTSGKGADLVFRDLEISFTGTAPEAVFAANGVGRMRFERCTFTDMSQPAGATFFRDLPGGWTIFDGCSFVDSAAFAPIRFEGTGVVSTCTFAGLKTESLGIVEIHSGAVATLANSTFTDLKSEFAAVYVAPDVKERTKIVNCVIVGNDNAAGEAGELALFSSADLYHVIVRFVHGAARYTTTNCVKGATVYKTSMTAATFAGERSSTLCDGLPRHYRPLARNGSSERRGCYVWHDADWSRVACSPDFAGRQMTSVRGDVSGDFSSQGVRTRISADILARPVPPSEPSPGSYEALLDADAALVDGALVVNSIEDELTDEYDGVVTLRDALEYLLKLVETRQPNGDAVVTFAPALTKMDAAMMTLRSAPPVITGFTNSTLTVRGPSTGPPLIFDGNAAHRAIVVGAGNRVRFENLVFDNCRSEIVPSVANTAGGAVYNAGTADFSNCVFTASGTSFGAVGSGHAAGGALVTIAGATSRVERCTFAGNSAGWGGALATLDDGFATVFDSTFVTNAARVLSAVGGGLGGAVASLGRRASTVLVNCTLAANSAEDAGGAVTDFGALEGDTTVRLLNTIALGNTSGLPQSADFHFIGLPALDYVVTDASDALRTNLIAAATVTRKSPGEVFAETIAGRIPLATNVTRGAVTHAVVPLVTGAALPAAAVKADATRANIAYGSSSAAVDCTLIGSAARADEAITADQEEDSGDGSLFVGATRRTGASRELPLPPPDNPLEVKEASFEALKGVLAVAAADPSLAVDGELRIVFAPGVTEILFTNQLELAAQAFDPFVLTIAGPVRFRSDGSTRFFSLGAGMRVRFESVEFVGGVGETVGGAIYAYAAEVTAKNCTFRGNRAINGADGYGGFGGAVCFEGEASVGTFDGCRFEENAAEADAESRPGVGQAIYRDDTHLALYGCTFDGELSAVLGWRGVAARVEKASGRIDWFDSVAKALTDCGPGDRLVLMSKDAPDVTLIELPEGVELVDETASHPALLAQAANALRARVPSWYTVSESATKVAAQLNEEARPEISGEEGQVDLVSDDVVRVMPTNVKPNLTYGLGRSETPGGTYVVKEDGWVQADANGVLPRPLTAPKSGSVGFYRVIVK